MRVPMVNVRVMRRIGQAVICLLSVLHFSGSAASAASCPVEKITSGPYRQVCFHDVVNVTVSRCLHDFGDEVHVNYTVDRRAQNPTPITIDVYQKGQTRPEAYPCRNGSLSDILRVVFMKGCEDPVVIVNRTATVNLQLDVEVNFTYMDMLCNTILIGPQRLNLSCQVDPKTGQLTPFVQLLNIDTCSRVGPAVSINISTSMNSFITLFTNGSNKTMGDISLQPLPCGDSHTQVWRVSVPFTANYTVTADITLALLPKSCILVSESNCSAVPTPQDDPSTTQPIIAIAVSIALVVFVVAIVSIVIAIAVCLCCKYYCCAKSGKNETRGSVAEVTARDAKTEEEVLPGVKRVARQDEQHVIHRNKAMVGKGGAVDDKGASRPADSTGHRHTQTAEIEESEMSL